MVVIKVRKVYVITYPTPLEITKLLKIKDEDYVIGVDQAVFYMYKQRIKVDLAVGDFDSLQHKSLLFGLKAEVLPSKKDETDTFYALKKAYDISNDVTLIGGAYGERLEHMYVHMMFFHHFPKLIMQTEYSMIRRIDEDTTLDFKGFINIFPYPEAVISLKGFMYPLDSYEMKPFDVIGISNHLTQEKGYIKIHKGSILLIETHEKVDNKKSA